MIPNLTEMKLIIISNGFKMVTIQNVLVIIP